MQHKKTNASVQRLLDAAFEYQRMTDSSSGAFNEDFGLCSDPTQYDWQHIGKQEMLVPYNCAITQSDVSRNVRRAAYLKSQPIRWERHYVWIVEGVLCRGESNILPRRRFYLDDDSWMVLLGEAYDIAGTMVKTYLLDSYIISQARALGRWYDL